MIASTPSQGLTEYSPGDTALLDTLLDNIGSIIGLTPPSAWCAVGVRYFIPCDGLDSHGDLASFSVCPLAPPAAAYQAAEQSAGTHQSAGSVALYVVFYNWQGSSSFPAFPISLPAAFPPPVRYCIAAPNSVGPGAQIDIGGTTSLGANNLVLRAGAVPNGPGLFFLGSLQAQVPFGDGFRCVGGSILRLRPELASGGQLVHAVDFTSSSAAGAILAGSTWNVQAWYRDPAAGGAGFNLSDALEITFCP